MGQIQTHGAFPGFSMEKKTAAAPRKRNNGPRKQKKNLKGSNSFSGTIIETLFEIRLEEKDCGKPSAHRGQNQDNSRPKEKYCMANESGAHMARAEDFIFGEYVTRDKMWPQTPQGGGLLSLDSVGLMIRFHIYGAYTFAQIFQPELEFH